jgi:hypothetical protein
MFLSALISLLIVAAPSTESWSTYANERYGYSIQVPPELVGQGEAGNGDGQEFKDASGQVRLKVWASLVVELDAESGDKTDLAYARKLTLERWSHEGVKITYQPRAKGWWVLSGEDPKGRVLYLKELEKDGVVYGFEWSHPRGAKKWQDLTGAVARGFKLP